MEGSVSSTFSHKATKGCVPLKQESKPRKKIMGPGNRSSKQKTEKGNLQNDGDVPQRATI